MHSVIGFLYLTVSMTFLVIILFYLCLVNNNRASSAIPTKIRPLGQPRRSEAKDKRRARSAEYVREIFKPVENQAHQISMSVGKHVDQGSASEEKLLHQVAKVDKKQVNSNHEMEQSQEAVDNKAEESILVAGKCQWNHEAFFVWS